MPTSRGRRALAACLLALVRLAVGRGLAHGRRR